MPHRRTLLALIGLTVLTSLLVMPAVNHPVSDLGPRLRATHWLWTGVMHTPPAVHPDDPNVWRWPVGVPGRNGTIHPWFGVGQSLILLPADVVVTIAATAVPALRAERWHRQLVTYLTLPVLHGVGIAVAFVLLLALGVPRAAAVTGAVMLLFGTTYLWHVQNGQENSQQFFLTAAALAATLRWARTNNARWLTVAALLVGFNLLIRVTTIADVVGVGVFALLLGWGRAGSVRTIVIRFAPVVAGYAVVDRLYQWVRFGTVTDTYMTRLGEQMRLLNPGLSPHHPFEGNFLDGFVGVFTSPAKSIFVYDPLMLFTVCLVVWQWRKLPREWRAYVVAMSVILIATAAEYATYYNWEGETGWGNRFVTTPVFGLALVAVPLAVRFGVARPALAGLLSVACVIQCASLVFPSWAELVQNGMEVERFTLLPGCRPSTDYFVLGQRFQNIWLWMSTGATSATCAGHPTGTPLALWGLLPFTSLSAELRWLAKGLWAIGCLGVWWWASRILAEARRTTP